MNVVGPCERCTRPADYLVGSSTFMVPACRRHVGAAVAGKLDAGMSGDTTTVRRVA